jgi:ferredoxin
MINKELLAYNKKLCQERADKLPELSAIAAKPEGVCPVAWAKEIVSAARAEACGKSVMCRDGLWQVELILEALTSNEAKGENLELLREVLDAMKTVGCPNTKKTAELVLALMDTYADEWDLHARRHRCTALVCPSFYNVYIDPAACQGCHDCVKAAPEGSIAYGDGMISVVVDDSGLKTAAVLGSCPHGAIKKYNGPVKPRTPDAPVPVGSFADAAAGGAAGSRRRRRG